jgi:hypothetical protein
VSRERLQRQVQEPRIKISQTEKERHTAEIIESASFCRLPHR